MGLRISLGHFLIRLGRFIQSLALMSMRPDDLVEFSRQTYAKQVSHWGSEEVTAEGLSPLESCLLEKVPLKKGRLLVLGVGRGRDAIPLARLGLEGQARDIRLIFPKLPGWPCFKGLIFLSFYLGACSFRPSAPRLGGNLIMLSFARRIC
jgi:hypothetical protein